MPISAAAAEANTASDHFIFISDGGLLGTVDSIHPKTLEGLGGSDSVGFQSRGQGSCSLASIGELVVDEQDLRRWGALLTVGWERSSGSPEMRFYNFFSQNSLMFLGARHGFELIPSVQPSLIPSRT